MLRWLYDFCYADFERCCVLLKGWIFDAGSNSLPFLRPTRNLLCILSVSLTFDRTSVHRKPSTSVFYFVNKPTAIARVVRALFLETYVRCGTRVLYDVHYTYARTCHFISFFERQKNKRGPKVSLAMVNVSLYGNSCACLVRKKQKTINWKINNLIPPFSERGWVKYDVWILRSETISTIPNTVNLQLEAPGFYTLNHKNVTYFIFDYNFG